MAKEVAHYNVPIYATKGSRDHVIGLRNVYIDNKGYYISYKNKKTYVVKHNTRFVSFKLSREATMRELHGSK